MSKHTERHRGQVVSFSPRTGYGFIQPDKGGANIFVHATQIRRKITLVSGDPVEFSLKRTPHGTRAFNVQPHLDNMIQGRIKWFDEKGGFGFLRTNLADDNIFFHRSSIRSWGKPNLAEGDEVKFLAVEAPKGLQAIDVRKRDHSIRLGQIKQFDPNGKGHGHIRPDTGGHDLHINNSSVTSVGLPLLNASESVEYSMRAGREGQPAAYDVRVLSKKQSSIKDKAPQRSVVRQITEIELAKIDSEKQIRLAEIYRDIKELEYDRDVKLSEHSRDRDIKSSEHSRDTENFAHICGLFVCLIGGVVQIVADSD